MAANARDVALMFSFRGDHVGKHNVPERKWIDEREQLQSRPPMPVFDPLSSMFFYLGLAVALNRARRSATWLLAIAWFLIMSFNSILSFGAPNILRTLAMTPIVALLMGEGLLIVGDLAGRNRLCGKAAWGVVAACFLWFAGWQTWSYFQIFPRAALVWGQFNTGFCEMANFALDRAPDSDVYLPGDRWSHASAKYLTHGASGIYELTLPEAVSRSTEAQRPVGEDEQPRKRIILFTQWTGIGPELMQLYPMGAVVHEFRDPYGQRWAWAFSIPPQALKSKEEIERHFAGKIGISVFPER